MGRGGGGEVAEDADADQLCSVFMCEGSLFSNTEITGVHCIQLKT